MDTGLGRNGATLADWDTLVGEAMEYQDQGLLRVVGIFSHLAVADEPERPETDQQLAAFREALAVAEDAGVDAEVRHLANTPATLSRPDTHFDLVRVGLGIYGLSPFDGQTSAELGLRPAMTLRTMVSQCKEVPAGQGVSYGLNYRTAGASTLGLIPLGYADGVPRVATGGPVRVAGTTYPVVGRIAMDQMVIDLGPRSPTGAGAVWAPRRCCSATEPTAVPRLMTGRAPPGPSTMRSSRGSARACRAASSTNGHSGGGASAPAGNGPCERREPARPRG